MSFRVRFTRYAADDFERVLDFILERKMAHEGGGSAFLRELIMLFGPSGHVDLFEITSASSSKPLSQP